MTGAPKDYAIAMYNIKHATMVQKDLGAGTWTYNIHYPSDDDYDNGQEYDRPEPTSPMPDSQIIYHSHSSGTIAQPVDVLVKCITNYFDKNRSDDDFLQNQDDDE